MRRGLLMGAILAASPWLIGCSGTGMQTELAQVAVRFVIPPEPEPFADTDTDVEARWVVDTPYDGFIDTDSAVIPVSDAYHVALWGGPFEGNDVTYDATALAPGSYTFAYLDRPDDSMMQGWLEVNYEGKDLLDYLYKWKNSIPEQKQQLAYEYEISGRMNAMDPAAFTSLDKQLQAFDRLEKQLDAAIAAETKAHTARHQQVGDLLRDAEILVLPGTDQVFHATTRPAFSPDDFEAVRAGGALTKMVLVADHQDAQWKLRCVDQLYDDLTRCKAVMGQEADRLERRKGLFLLTDHLHNHDKRFVENEMRLQVVLSAIDRLDQRMSDLGKRRMALAFISELVAPDGTFRALDQEERDLLQEKAVAQAEKNRLDLLFDESDENSTRRVALERNRLHVAAAIDAFNMRLADLGKARTALQTMTESTDVIHRQGDTRLLTATVVEEQLPFTVRQAIQRESLMTVRLQIEDDVFVPAKANVARAGAFTPATYPRTQRTAEGQYEPSPPSTKSARADAAQFTRRQEQKPQVTPPGLKAEWTPPPSPRPAHADTFRLTNRQGTEPQVAPPRDQVDRVPSPRPAHADAVQFTKRQDHKPRVAPPRDQAEWIPSPSPKPERADTVQFADQLEQEPQVILSGDQERHAQTDKDDCPLWLKLLAPPCWLANRDKDNVAADEDKAWLAHQPEYQPQNREKVNVAANEDKAWPAREPEYQPQKVWSRDQVDWAQSDQDDCPLWLKLLVPPCWLANLDKTNVAAADDDAQLADFRDEQGDSQDDQK
ncbi:MAG: hypothetical protein JSU86_12865 [Phycisphaerales bacterium]|nr:MAG: hypothetical protein JSU86_12865 [Phycisphaerales bacterium]